MELIYNLFGDNLILFTTPMYAPDVRGFFKILFR